MFATTVEYRALRPVHAPTGTLVARPDVALIIGKAGACPGAERIAAWCATNRKGAVQVMRYADDAAAGPARAEPLGVARLELASMVSRFIRTYPDVRVVERLHAGSLESLLRTLGDTVGIAVIAGDPAGSRGAVAACDVPVLMVDVNGAVLVAARHPSLSP